RRPENLEKRRGVPFPDPERCLSMDRDWLRQISRTAPKRISLLAPSSILRGADMRFWQAGQGRLSLTWKTSKLEQTGPRTRDFLGGSVPHGFRKVCLSGAVDRQAQRTDSLHSALRARGSDEFLGKIAT